MKFLTQKNSPGCSNISTMVVSCPEGSSLGSFTATLRNLAFLPFTVSVHRLMS